MKRFYKNAAAARDGEGWSIALDGKPIKTPARAQLTVPTEALAAAIADEWNAQGDEVKPRSMSLMQLACTAIDRVAPQREAVIEEIACFGRADMLCYRVEGPVDLVERQVALWQPWVEWADRALGARLATTRGVQAVAQPPEALAALRRAVAAYDPFRLAALHALTTAYGSLVLGLAALRGAASPEAAWAAARCDEAYQEERWGEDAEATKRVRSIAEDAGAALRFSGLLVG